MTPPSRERLDEIWRGISRIDAPPVRIVSIGAPGAREQIREFFDDYIRGSAVWLDSAQVAPRPQLIAAATTEQCMALNRAALEFVIVRDDEPSGFRAITDEEYEWYLYSSDASMA